MFSKVSDIVEGFWEVGSGAKKGFKSVQIRIAASFLSVLRKYVVVHWFYSCRRHELGPTIGAHSYTDNMCRLGVEVMLCEKNLGRQTNKLQSSFMACSLPAWRFTSAPNLIANLPRILENAKNLCCSYQIHCFVGKIAVFLEKTRFWGKQMQQNGSYWL